MSNKNSIAESPLLHSRTAKNISNVNPEKLEFKRFTDRSDTDGSEKTNTVKILIYLLIVIGIGVGAALFINNLINQSEDAKDDEQTQDDDQDDEQTQSENVTIDLVEKEDNTAVLLANNNDYSDDTLTVIGSASVDTKQVTLNKVNYTKYKTFGRLEFKFQTPNNSLPTTTVQFESLANRLNIKLALDLNIIEDLKADFAVNSTVKEIRYNASSNEYVVFLSDSAKYRVAELDGTLMIDIKLEDDFGTPTDNTDNDTDSNTDDDDTDSGTDDDTDTDTDTDTGTDTGKPTTNTFDNTFSKNTQYLVSGLTGKKVDLNGYYYWDQGGFFEISFGQQGLAGKENTPNTKAYYKKEDGKFYIMLEIDNLTGPFNIKENDTVEEFTDGQVNPDGVSVISVQLESFTNGKAIYKIEVKKEVDFRLASLITADQKTQIVAIQIKD